MFDGADGVLTDAMPLPQCDKDVISLVKGDQKSVSIAAASILAKVTRDCIMYVTINDILNMGLQNTKDIQQKHIWRLCIHMG